MGKKVNIYQLLKAKKYVEAFKIAREIIELGEWEKDQAEILRGNIYLAIVYTKRGQYEKSKIIFDKYFSQLIPELGSKWHGKELVQTYLAYNELKSATIYLDNFLIANPLNAEALLLKAHVLLKQNRYAESEKVLRKLRKQYPSHSGISFALARVLRETKDRQGSFECFEHALDSGKNEALEDIFKFLFQRTGICDYQNCSDCCCSDQLLTGTSGKNISNPYELERLVLMDSRNKCWIKKGKSEGDDWVFECKNLECDNNCREYDNRPQICRDYPNTPLNLNKACSYRFILRDELPLFTLPKVLAVVLDILEAGKYLAERKQLLQLNGGIFLKEDGLEK